MISTRAAKFLLHHKHTSQNIYRYFSNSSTNFCVNAGKAEENTTETIAPENNDPISIEITRLTEENTNLTSQIADIQDKYKRTLADRENVRNRLGKQIVEAKQFGIQGFCKDLLEVSDVFSKAIESVPPEELKDNNSLKNLYDGLVMTESTLFGVLTKHKLSKIELKVGDKFNPSEQEAMFEVPSSEIQSPGTVAHILRPGWKLRDRCIRSVQVGVVKN